MDRPPLSLSLLRLSPQSLFVPDPDDPPPPSPIAQEPESSEDVIPALSTVHNYPGAYPSASLGSNLAVLLELRNVSNAGVRGVKMMCEVQSPGGRYRLGEVVHGQEEQTASAPEEPKPEKDEGAKEEAEGPANKADGGSSSELDSETEPPTAAPVSTAAEPELPPGDDVRLDVATEMKELGLHVLICSVAWETPDGRRTFQRFLKFNVTPPLAIKTRIYSSPHPNTALDSIAREYIYLEILMQNISFQGMIFDRILLETVHGLSTLQLSDEEGSRMDGMEEVVMPGDTKQQLFKLAPSPRLTVDSAESDEGVKLGQSSFLPIHPPGSILPLGRLDLSWRAGQSHDRGRLQTSTLNRRIPQAQLPISGHTPSSSVVPTRTTTAAAPSPAHASTARIGSPKPPLPPKDDTPSYEFDLVVSGKREVQVEDEFEMEIRVAVRTAPVDDEVDQPEPPEPIHIGIQYLPRSPAPPVQRSVNPTPVLDPSSRISTPMSARSPTVPTPANMSRTSTLTSAPRASMGSRPFSPLSSPPMSSQPMSPVQSQLRQATNQTLYSPKLDVSTLTARSPPPPGPSVTFPPLPVLTGQSVTGRLGLEGLGGREQPQHGLLDTGRTHHLGASLLLAPPQTWILVEERMGTTYTDPIAPSRRWEAVHSLKTKFIALDEGLAELGGLRVLVLDDETGLSGSVGREWESLGDVWVVE